MVQVNLSVTQSFLNVEIPYHSVFVVNNRFPPHSMTPLSLISKPSHCFTTAQARSSRIVPSTQLLNLGVQRLFDIAFGKISQSIEKLAFAELFRWAERWVPSLPNLSGKRWLPVFFDLFFAIISRGLMSIKASRSRSCLLSRSRSSRRPPCCPRRLPIPCRADRQ